MTLKQVGSGDDPPRHEVNAQYAEQLLMIAQGLTTDQRPAVGIHVVVFYGGTNPTAAEAAHFQPVHNPTYVCGVFSSIATRWGVRADTLNPLHTR